MDKKRDLTQTQRYSVNLIEFILKSNQSAIYARSIHTQKSVLHKRKDFPESCRIESTPTCECFVLDIAQKPQFSRVNRVQGGKSVASTITTHSPPT